jgi:hypothetical protein
MEEQMADVEVVVEAMGVVEEEAVVGELYPSIL